MPALHHSDPRRIEILPELWKENPSQKTLINEERRRLWEMSLDLPSLSPVRQQLEFVAQSLVKNPSLALVVEHNS